MNRNVIGWSAAAILAVGVTSSAMARPGYLQAFKAHYNTAQGKPTLNASNCSLCHVGMPNQGMWNPYGQAVRTALGARMVTDRARVVAALQAAERGRNASQNQTFGALIQGDRLPAGAGPARPAAPAAPAGPATLSGTWEPLFNGVNTDGWTKMNQGDWKVENGVLKYTGGGNGWLRSNRQFGNYALVVVWKYTQPGNNDSGIFLKAAMEGNPWPRSPQLNMGPNQNFGSIGGTMGSRPRADLIKPTDWNTYQLTVMNGVATLNINGQPAWDMAAGDSLNGQGYLGLQAEGRPVEFAQIWVMPLP